MTKITYSKSATRDLLTISRADAQRILGKIETLAATPAALANNVKQLTGSEDFRLRVGDYRVIFGRPDSQTILVKRVRHRREAYK